jgi:hypothetical protein
MAYFYEIRSADNTGLKRDGGFASQDAAKMAARDDAKKMKNMRQLDRPDVGRIMVTREERDSSARSVPRNDNALSFSANCKTDAWGTLVS